MNPDEPLSPPSRTVVGYVRAAFDEPVEAFAAAIERYAVEHGLTVWRIYRDTVVGDDIRRPGYALCLRDCAQGFARTIVTPSDEHLAGNEVLRGALVRQAKVVGASVVVAGAWPARPGDPFTVADPPESRGSPRAPQAGGARGPLSSQPARS